MGSTLVPSPSDLPKPPDQFIRVQVHIHSDRDPDLYAALRSIRPRLRAQKLVALADRALAGTTAGNGAGAVAPRASTNQHSVAPVSTNDVAPATLSSPTHNDTPTVASVGSSTSIGDALRAAIDLDDL